MIFDFHYHLLFKHYIHEKPEPALAANVKTRGLASVLNGIFGGPFNSQSSPTMVANSPLKIGVIAVISLEHAFANQVLHLLGINFSGALPLDQKLFERTRDGATTYYDEFKNQVKHYITHEADLKQPQFDIHYLRRKDWAGLKLPEIEKQLNAGTKKYMAFSIEGGHNLSNVPINKDAKSHSPQLQLKAIQDGSELDFISMNLCHLSSIREQTLGGFAQGVNKMSQIAFKSNDFMPKNEFGITEIGKKVIRQAYTHDTKPMLIDVKHMSLYSRLHFYKIRDKLILEHPKAGRLPIISSHTGFTFTTVTDYIQNKRFRSKHGSEEGDPSCIVEPENRKIGRTNDLVNKGLFCNPWTINLFDEDIVEIMESGGMMGISLDQRVLGTSNPAVDSVRDKYFEGEHVAKLEWEKLFRDGQMPGAERIEFLEGIFAPRNERHLMLLCHHIVYAVRIGYEYMNWTDGKSPWDCICIGSDFDGLINPLNGFDNVDSFKDLERQLNKYLPQADKYLKKENGRKALDYDTNGNLDEDKLKQYIQKFLYRNGLSFIARYLTNWTG